MFIFPYPPSINSYWGFSGSHRYLTPRAKAFKAEVVLASIGHKKYGSNRLSVSIVLNPTDKRIRDIDNSIKSLLDAMCQAGLFDDDSQIDKLSVERGLIVKGGLCKVIILPLTI
jgi:crossover junction endodeoxyribonuclease RusA